MAKIKIYCFDDSREINEREETLLFQGCFETKKFIEAAFKLGFMIEIQYEDEFEFDKDSKTLH